MYTLFVILIVLASFCMIGEDHLDSRCCYGYHQRYLCIRCT